MEDKSVSENFMLSEFNYVNPDDRLLLILQTIRSIVNIPIKITDAARTFKEHVDIYKKLYKDAWEQHITWDSKHLPMFEMKLRAVDFCIEGYTGIELRELVKKVSLDLNIIVGIGTGSNFIHLDIDRQTMTYWDYSY